MLPEARFEELVKLEAVRRALVGIKNLDLHMHYLKALSARELSVRTSCLRALLLSKS